MKTHLLLVGYSDGHDDHTVNVEPQPEPTKRKPSGSGERSTMMEGKLYLLCQSEGLLQLSNH
jgi:hypothetical protein